MGVFQKPDCFYEVMKMNYMKFSTATTGAAAQQLLRSNGIVSALKRNPKPDHREGCTFALYVRGDIRSAERLVRRAGIPLLGVDGDDT